MTSKANDLALGIDVGGTHLRAALVDKSGNMVASVRRHLAAREPEGLLDLFEDVRRELNVPVGNHVPMGVGLAAQILVRSGMVPVSPNLGWRNVPFGDMLRQRFQQPVRLVNDLNAIAMGEALCGAGGGAEDVVCVFVGTGVGMGALVHGRVVEGADGLATELGHIKVESVSNGRLCGCGEHGCLEAYTSGRHLPDLFMAKVQAGLHSLLGEQSGGDANKLTAGHIELAATAGDQAAITLWEEVCEYLARAIGNTVTLFNPSVLILGGGVLNAAPRLKTALTERIGAYAGRPAQHNLKIRDAVLADAAGAVGAAMLARQVPS